MKLLPLWFFISLHLLSILSVAKGASADDSVWRDILTWKNARDPFIQDGIDMNIDVNSVSFSISHLLNGGCGFKGESIYANTLKLFIEQSENVLKKYNSFHSQPENQLTSFLPALLIEKNAPYAFYHKKIFSTTAQVLSQFDEGVANQVIERSEQVIHYYNDLEPLFRAILKEGCPYQFQSEQFEVLERNNLFKTKFQLSHQILAKFHFYSITLSHTILKIRENLIKKEIDADLLKEKLVTLEKLFELLRSFSYYQKRYIQLLFHSLIKEYCAPCTNKVKAPSKFNRFMRFWGGGASSGYSTFAGENKKETN